MKVLLVARTTGPMKNLARVAGVLSDRNHEVAAVLSKDPGSMVAPIRLVEDFKPDVVLATTSSMNIGDELAVLETAIRLGIPYAVFADTYGAFNRSEVSSEIKKDCALVFVPDESDAEFAQKVGYPKAMPVGVPLWEDYADNSRYPDRNETRAKLGIQRNEVMMMSSFGKDFELNKRLFKEVVDVASRVNAGNPARRIVFVPRIHPGDQAAKTDPNCYREVLKSETLRIVDSSAFKSSDDLVPALDVLISQASALGINCIYQRQPVIEYMIEPVVARLKQQTGRDTWPPVESGAALMASDPHRLFELLKYCVDDRLRNHTRIFQCQEEAYPVVQGGAAKKIADALEGLVKAKK